ncbi:hypothetical protein AOLI_G00224310 [Acnodon oligacanthus]
MQSCQQSVLLSLFASLCSCVVTSLPDTLKHSNSEPGCEVQLVFLTAACRTRIYRKGADDAVRGELILMAVSEEQEGGERG